MPRPHEIFADAIRTARDIVENEVSELARIWDGDAAHENERIERLKDALAQRIAEAIAEAEEAGRAWATSEREQG